MKDSCISATANLVDTAALDNTIAAACDTAATDMVVSVAATEAAPAEDENSIGRGVELMVIGMLTVFAILLIVINLGKLLIKIVNVIAPEEQVAPKKAATATTATIDANTMAILEQTVSQITGGKGRVASAKKI